MSDSESDRFSWWLLLQVQHATMQQGLLIIGDDQGSLFALGANGDIEWQTSCPDGAGKVASVPCYGLLSTVLVQRDVPQRRAHQGFCKTT